MYLFGIAIFTIILFVFYLVIVGGFWHTIEIVLCIFVLILMLTGLHFAKHHNNNQNKNDNEMFQKILYEPIPTLYNVIEPV